MNPRLFALLVGVATVGGVAVYTLGTNPDTGQPAIISDLVDAGVTSDCAPRIGSCTVRLDADGVNVALDAGFLVSWDGGLPVYAQVKTGVERCSDGGVIVPRLIARGLDPDQDHVRFLFQTCSLSPCNASPLCAAQNLGKPSNVQIDSKPCRKRPPGAPVASCQLQLDGGLYDFGDGNVMPAALAVGAGCAPASCVVTDPAEDP